MIIEFHQWDWIPVFAAFINEKQNQDSKSFFVLNLGAFLSAIDRGELPREKLIPEVVESILHEIVHAVEKWADAEFSENRVDALLEKYRKTLNTME